MFSRLASLATNKLCSTCNRFVESDYRESKHHGTLLNLRSSSGTGSPHACPLCCLLWASVQSGYSPSLERATVGDLAASNYVLGLAYNKQAQPYEMRILRASASGGSQSIVGAIKAVPQDDVATGPNGLSLHGAEPTSNWSAWNLSSSAIVRTWLHECHAQHPGCGRLGPKKAPTRMVDISDASRYKLIETTADSRQLYVALSYVWGEKINGQSIHRVKLTKATRDGLKEAIEPALMTASHREAIRVASELGYQYIWIDALCIIQDDPVDWKEAAVEIPDIYGNAALTIIAGRGLDSRQGFLRNLQPVRLPHNGSGARKRVSTLELSLMDSRTIGPTDERAWCFQESLLSRRSLIFGTGQLIYRCLKNKKFQDGKHDYFMFDEATFELNWVLPTLPEAPRAEHLKITHTQNDILRGWYRVAQMYAMKSIYDPFDCYAALANIARKCESALASASKDGVAPRYLCGVWETESFAHGLMWRRCLEGGSLKKPGPPDSHVTRAPSWSWMALVGRIIFHCAPVTTTGAPRSTFHRAPCCVPAAGMGRAWSRDTWAINTHLETEEIQKSLPFQIWVKGRPRRVRVTLGGVREFMMILKYASFENPHGTISDAERPHLKLDGVVLRDMQNPHEEKGIALALFDCKPARYAELWALPILTIGIGRLNIPSEGLLLSKSSKGVFHRVGIFWIRDAKTFMEAKEQIICIE